MYLNKHTCKGKYIPQASYITLPICFCRETVSTCFNPTQSNLSFCKPLHSLREVPCAKNIQSYYIICTMLGADAVRDKIQSMLVPHLEVSSERYKK